MTRMTELTPDPPRTLVLCYSRTGHSRAAAERLASEAGADLKNLTPHRYSDGIFGLVRAAFDSLRQISLPTPANRLNLSDYDRLILCGPVWTSYPAVPLRDILRLGDRLPPSVSLFLTCGTRLPEEKTWQTAEADLGRPLAARGFLPNGWEGKAREENLFAKFLADLDMN